MLKYLFLLILAAVSGAAEAQSWIAYGDLRGYLEPCGCDPATDMGGVRRLTTLIKREKMQRPDLAVYGLGNAMPVSPQFALKIPFLVEAEASMGAAAILFNTLELKNAADIAKATQKPPYVLTNTKTKLPNVRPFIATSDALVLGYVDDKALPKVDAAMLGAWRKLVAKEGAGKKPVLLFSGDAKQLATVLKASLFDIVISSNSSPLDVDPGLREKNAETLLLRDKAKDVWMVPLGGQGLLRGGGARFAEAKSISELFSKTSTQSATNDSPFAQAKFVTWLLPDVGGADEMKDLFARYDQASKAAFAAAGEERAKDLATTPFAGATTCATCHPSAMQVWEKSKHAHAMATLAGKGKDRDGECVACHAVGAKEKGGFVSMEKSPQFANVQCEVCHGAAKAHAANPTTVKTSPTTKPREVCVGCHHGTHSPEFELTKYWDRIKHGK